MIPIKDVAGAAEIPCLAASIPRRDRTSCSLAVPVTLHSGIKRKRSQSTSSSDKKRDPNYVRRPPNSFILFRKYFVANRPVGYHVPENKSLSKQAAEAWKRLPPSEKEYWVKEAYDIAIEHARRNPEWRYKPSRKIDKARKEPQSPPSQKTSLCEKEAPSSHTNSVPGVPPEDNVQPPHLMRRRESFRLNNWDDSVINPHVYSTSYSNEGLDQLPESLRRRSSSVPVPNLAGSSADISPALQGQECPPAYDTLFHSNTQRRLSYSGIRPGFTPLDIFESYKPLSRCDLFDGPPLQPLSSLADGPPPSFEGYKITVVSREPGPSETLRVSPFSQISPHESIPSAPGFGDWQSRLGFVEPIYAPGSSKGVSVQQTAPDVLATSPPTDLSRNVTTTYPKSSGSGQRHQVTSTSQVRPDPLVDCMSFADFCPTQLPNPDRSKRSPHGGYTGSSLPSTDVFPLDTPPMDFFPQIMNDSEGPRLPAWGAIDGEGAVQSQCNNDVHGLEMGQSLPDLDIFSEFLVASSSGQSACGSGAWSSPPSQQLGESAFGE